MINSTTNPQNSEEIREIIGQVPNWVVRWGITFSLLVLIMVIGISKYLYFPVTLSATAVFIPTQTPYRIRWKPGEPLMRYNLQVADQQSVKRSDTVLIGTNLRTGDSKFYTVPFSGKIVIFQGGELSSQVSLLVEIPDSSRYQIELEVPLNGAGQVDCGQKVLVSLAEFPESKYGFLMAEISSCDLVELNRSYRFKIKLLNGMRTNTNKLIPSSVPLNGNARIVIENISVFDKIFSGVLR